MHVATSSLSTVRQLYSAGLYLQAYEAGKGLGALATWQGSEGQILAGRMAGNLGAPRLSRVLHALAYRQAPDNWECRFYHAMQMLGRCGPLRTWQLMQACGDVGEDQPRESRVNWLALKAQVLAQFRDFQSAEHWQALAESLAPDDAWVWVERATLYERQDRLEDALAACQHALELRPFYRPAVQYTAHMLTQLGRDQPCLALLREATERLESGDLWAQRGMLESELGMYQEAAESFERARQFLPLMEKSYRLWIFGRLADAAYELGDRQRAIEFYRLTDWEHYTRFADALSVPNAQYRRKLLNVGFVRQQHMTCGPATLAAISSYWNHPADHLQIAEQICYDGTPAQSERRWAEENGFIAREFTVTWESACALVERGIPFTLTTVGPGAGHLQAVIGYDECRRSLSVRDPNTRLSTEYAIDALLEAHRATGPRGMTLVPQASAHLLDGVELPEADLYDHFNQVQRQLELHERDAAWQEYQQLAERAPGHRLTWYARRSLAAYDCDPAAGLQAIEELLEQFPDDENLQLGRLNHLQVVATREACLEALHAYYQQHVAKVLITRLYAQELANDARQTGEATRILTRVVRWARDDAKAYHLLAELTWDTAREQSLLLYRWASGLEATNEDFAMAYFGACRHMQQVETGLEWLYERFHRLHRKSAGPTRTLCWALDTLNRLEEMFQVLEQALADRPDDGDLLIYAAELCSRFNQPERSEELLQRAAGRVHRGALLNYQAQQAQSRGELQSALACWRELATLDPCSRYAHAQIAQLLYERQSAAAAVEHLQAAAARFPYNLPLQQLLIEWLRTRDPAELETAVRNLIAAHPQDAWAHRELALVLLREQRIDEAAAAAETARDMAPLHPATWSTLAQVAVLQGDSEAARRHHRRALELSIDSAADINCLLDLCRTNDERREELAFIQAELARQTTYGEGLQAFQSAAQRLLDAEALLGVLREAHAARRDLWHSWSALISQLLEMQRLDEAHALAVEATQRFSLLPDAWTDLARVAQAQQDVASERAALERALAIRPSRGLVLRRLAEICERQNEPQQALELLEQAVNRDPSDPQNHGGLADLLWLQGQRDRAIEHLTRALRLAPGYEWAWNTLSAWLNELGRSEELITLAQALADDRPGEARNWLNLAKAQIALRQFDAALKNLDRAILLRPELTDAHDQRADLLAELGRFDEALAACAPPHWAEDPPLELQGRAADILARQGKLDEAIEQMCDVTKASPDYYWGWMRLAQWYDAQRMGKKCLRACRELVRCVPKWSVAHGYLGDAERQYGDPARARQEFLTALELDPEYLFAGTSLVEMSIETDPPFAAAMLEKLAERHQAPYLAELNVRLGLATTDYQRMLQGWQTLCSFPNDMECLLRAVSLVLPTRRRKEAQQILAAAMERPDCNPNLGVAWIEFNSGAAGRHWITRRQPKDAVCHAACNYVLEQLASARGSWRLQLFVRRNRHWIRSNTPLWGETGRAFFACQQYRQAIRWMADWPTREGLEPWMLTNLALTYWALGKRKQAMAVAGRALSLPADHATDMVRVIVRALYLGAIKRHEFAAAPLPSAPHQLSDYFRLMHDLTEAFVALENRPDSERLSLGACRRRIARALGNRWPQVSADRHLCELYRRQMQRLARRRKNWLMVLGYSRFMPTALS